MSHDKDNLKLISILHYVYGFISLFFMIFPFLYVGIGVFALTSGGLQDDEAKIGGSIVVLVGVIFAIVVLAFAIMTFLSARWISKRKNRMFSFVWACILCINVPFGTALGVATVIILSKESVIKEYEGKKALTQTPSNPYPM